MFFSVNFPLSAEDALAIIQKMEEQHDTGSSRAELRMLVYPDRDDTENHREMKLNTYTSEDGGSRLEFELPRSIKGLCILSKNNDQWVYFPSTGRVHRIAGKSKNESVRGVGGDFSYEDLGSGDMKEKYLFTIVSSESDQWIIKAVPKDPESIYGQLLVYVSKKNYLASKMEYFTKENGHEKDLNLEEVKIIKGKEVPTRMVMINYVKNSMTVIITETMELGIEINDKYFNPNRFYK
ncbi:MAG: outer membrane lipoprotein-sorting protein [Spirochaetales bacterium]|nr:outer membrane lipoprotein-sorting protein [Spirochaetales bacterium]